MAVQAGTPINIAAIIEAVLALTLPNALNDRAKTGHIEKCIYMAPLIIPQAVASLLLLSTAAIPLDSKFCLTSSSVRARL
jgi:hypothetical protein